MTLAATPTINSYVGTGGANNYSFSFLVFSQSDIYVTITSPTGSVYILILGTDFTVSTLNPVGGPPTTGSITLVNSSQAWLTGANLTSGWTIQIQRVVSLAQNTSFRNQGDFYPETHEAAFDYLMMAIQQINQALSVTVPLSLTVVTGNITLTTGGAGLIVTTPDGKKTYKISVDNNGQIGSTRLT